MKTNYRTAFCRTICALAVSAMLLSGCATASPTTPPPQVSPQSIPRPSTPATSSESGQIPSQIQPVAPTISPSSTIDAYAQVLRVIDGDTIEVRLTDGQVRKVRYIGIDTPERSEDLYTEATRANAGLVDGKEVSLVKDVSETDRYGRLLRYVYVGETFINAELVRQGYAAAATYPPDVAYAGYFVKLAAEAREKGVGLWSSETGRAPPETTSKQTQGQSPGAYIGNRNSKKFHIPSCRTLPAPHNQVPLASRDEAVQAGYVPCGNCNP